MKSLPLLSVCIPAYNRPVWLKRALESIGEARAQFYSELEIIVSDDSSEPTCGEVAQDFLQKWPGASKYGANRPRLGMAENWNHAISQATGEYVLVLHDDDFFVSGGVEKVLETLKALQGKYPVILFGVKVVGEQEQELKTQVWHHQQYLSPREALLRLLSNSSWVRFPAICLQRRVFREVGYFNPLFGEPTDLDMWIRLFSRYGVYRVPVVSCAYRVHSQALTMGVFKEETVQTLLGFFARVAQDKILSVEEVRDCQSRFFHQFILAGAFRMLRRGNLTGFRQVMGLFEVPGVRDLRVPRKWWLFRSVFGVLARLVVV